MSNRFVSRISTIATTMIVIGVVSSATPASAEEVIPPPCTVSTTITSFGVGCEVDSYAVGVSGGPLINKFGPAVTMFLDVDTCVDGGCANTGGFVGAGATVGPYAFVCTPVGCVSA